MADGQNLAWLSDYLVSVLKSPTWIAPIAQFIDERCDLFEDATEENELLFTTCHNEFKQLVNDLLVSHILEVSVQPEDFERFCEQGLAESTRLHYALVEQLLSVDDFLAFKAMMAKHSAELIREAVTCETFEDDGDTGGEASVQLMAAQVVASSIDEGLRSSDAEWQLYEDSLCKAYDEEGEKSEVQLRCEEAELAQFIALSLMAEEERLRQFAEEEVEPPAPTSPVHQPPAPLLPASAGTLSSPLQMLPPRMRLRQASRMVQVESFQRPQRGAWGFVSAPLCALPPHAQAAPAPAAVPASMPAVPAAAGFTSSPLCFRTRPPQAVSAAEEAVPRLPNAELECMRNNLRLWRERVSKVITRAQSSVGRPTPAAALRAAQQAAAAALPSEEERRQRAEHLARQRDRLKVKRQRDREQHMVDFQRTRGGSSLAASLDRAAGQAAQEEGRGLAAALAGGAPPLADPSATAERMRQAVTLQLRQTLLRTRASDAGTLDGQLSRLEMLRE